MRSITILCLFGLAPGCSTAPARSDGDTGTGTETGDTADTSDNGTDGTDDTGDTGDTADTGTGDTSDNGTNDTADTGTTDTGTGEDLCAQVECSQADEPCEERICNPETGACEAAPAPDGAPCDDGDVCTVSDACEAGICVSAAADCSALDTACTVGECDSASGECVIMDVPDGTQCDDSDPCTHTDVCAAGACSATPIDCSDLDAGCMAGSCDPETGECGSVPVDDGTPCDDGQACTDSDLCADGLCAGSAVDCSALDGPCAAGDCDALDGSCVTIGINENDPCEDGDLCTEGEKCHSGLCSGVAVDCAALDGDCVLGACDPGSGDCGTTPRPDGTPCDDGEVCSVDDQCTQGLCDGSSKDCSALDDTCAVGVCNPTDGACSPLAVNEGGGCDDGDACTQADTCAATQCAGTQADCSAQDGKCVVGTCDPSDGACIAVAQDDGLPCDDDNLCTAEDQCTQGQCTGAAVDCTAQDSDCSLGICVPTDGSCAALPVNEGGDCEDGDLCTIEETCAAGQCTGGSSWADSCPDPGLACQVAACDPATGACGATAAEDSSACDDGNACTESDSCTGGSCDGAPVDCTVFATDCRETSCDPSLGCVIEQLTGPACDDGDACTVSDACDGGECQATPMDCDDGNVCTVGDACDDGACVSDPVDCSAGDTGCLQGACDAADGTCIQVPVADDTPCDDGDPCTETDQCTAGGCGGAPVQCPASELCAGGACESALGCPAVPDPGTYPPDPGAPGAPCNDVVGCGDGLICYTPFATPGALSLCAPPCGSDADCDFADGTQALCVDTSGLAGDLDVGAICLRGCSDQACPAEHLCVPDADLGVAAFDLCLDLSAIACATDDDCDSPEVCTLLGTDGAAQSVCDDAFGTVPPGAPCPGESSPDSCTFACVNDALCSTVCAAKADCPAGMLCQVVTFGFGGGASAAHGACVAQDGSLAHCTKDADCPSIDEICAAFNGPLFTYGACVEPDAEAIEAGADCSAEDALCQSRICFGSSETCAALCDEAADCPAGHECQPFDVSVGPTSSTISLCHPADPCTTTADCPPDTACLLALTHEGIIHHCGAGAGDLTNGAPCDPTLTDPEPADTCDFGGFCGAWSVCSGLCTQDADCPLPTQLCAEAVNALHDADTPGDPTDDPLWTADWCVDAPGSRDPCAADIDCPPDEACAWIRRNGAFKTLCLTPAPSNAAPGEPCGLESDTETPCASRFCNTELDADAGTCTTPCLEDTDCPPGWTCGWLAASPDHTDFVQGCRDPAIDLCAGFDYFD